jgi:hypothetical protein
MTATRLDLVIEQGTDYQQPFGVVDSGGRPVDITGASAAMQIRTSITDPTALVTLTTASGTLAVNGPAGTITPYLDEDATTALQPGTYVYDLKMLDAGGRTTRPFEGTATVVAEVTTFALTPAVASGGQFNFSIAGNSGLAAGVM